MPALCESGRGGCDPVEPPGDGAITLVWKRGKKEPHWLPDGEPGKTLFFQQQTGVRHGIDAGELAKLGTGLHNAARIALRERDDDRIVGGANRWQIIDSAREIALQGIDAQLEFLHVRGFVAALATALRFEFQPIEFRRL